MHLSDHDLRQLDEAALARLEPERARALLIKALEDLKAARERLAQNPTNSSRPPSTRAPWEQAEAQGQEPVEGMESGDGVQGMGSRGGGHQGVGSHQGGNGVTGGNGVMGMGVMGMESDLDLFPGLGARQKNR